MRQIGLNLPYTMVLKCANSGNVLINIFANVSEFLCGSSTLRHFRHVLIFHNFFLKWSVLISPPELTLPVYAMICAYRVTFNMFAVLSNFCDFCLFFTIRKKLNNKLAEAHLLLSRNNQ